MSVLSAVAEHGAMADELTNLQVGEAAIAFAGKFKVVRVEIGSVTKGLSEILLDELS